MKRFFLFALVATVFAACSTDTTQDLAPEIPTAPDELQVSFDEEDTRIQLGENGAPVWTKGDLVSVFYKSDGNDCYKFTGKTGDREGTLKRTSVGEWSRRGDNVVVVYPYSKSYIISLSANTVEASLPAEQTYAKNSYGIGSSLMIATGDYKQFALKNVCGWLKLQFTGTGYVSKIVLRGNNGEQVAGNMLVCADDASCILAEASADIDDDEVGGALITDGDILTSVTLNCGDGVALNSETPTAFYVALPPQTFEKGLTAIMYNQDGIPKEISTENLITIERNHILPMASATLEMPIPSNEIWYTSSDGNVVAPYKTDVFGANIVSNTYENGVGVITFDGDVTTIGYSAFAYCSALTSVTIPDSVTTIGEGAFGACDALKAFYGKYASADNRCLIVDGVLNSFAPAGLTTYSIPDSVTEIRDYAFYFCDALTSVTIPDSVTEIGYGAFYSCDALTSVTIPDSVTTIGHYAFSSCKALTSVTIPDSVTTIGSGAFASCTALKAFYGKFASADNRCLIVDSVLNSFAPAGLTTYSIPDSVTKIGDSAFEWCDALTSVTIPNSVTTIGECAFAFCSALTSVTIPDSVTTIGYEAFWDCDALKSITIPNSVTTIGDEAFKYCNALKTVYCKPTTPPSLDNSSVFDYNASGRKIYVPTASVDAYKAADGWKEYADAIIAFPNNQIWYTSSDGNVVEPYATDVFGANIISNTYENGVGVITFDGDVTTIGSWAFYNCSALTSVTIPDSVTTIGDYAFRNCSALTSVTIPDSVTTIGDIVFRNCSALTSVTIGNGVTTIGSDAFYGCDALTSVTIPDSVTTIEDYAFRDCDALTSITIGNSVTTIGSSAFASCDALKTFYGKFASADNRCLIVNGVLNSFAPAGLTTYSIPDSVTTIGKYAFYDCDALTSVTIPDSVTTIGNYAFNHCSALTSVTIPNSVTTIGNSAFIDCDALKTFYGKFASEDNRCLIVNGVLNSFAIGCGLTTYSIPDSVTKIGVYAFRNCDALKSVTIPDSVTTIGNYAFRDCSALTSVTIPDSVTTIGIYAFDGCNALKTVYCKPTTPPSLGLSVFYGNASGRKIYVPTASVDAYKAADSWKEYASAIYPYTFTE